MAGPLVAAAVALGPRINLLKDSKLLTPQRREVLSVRIKQKAISYGIGWVEPAEIDQLGMTQATTLAMERAIAQISCGYDEIIVDGSLNYLKSSPKARAIIKADQTIPVVSAASIIAKVARDHYMHHIAVKFPNYQFEKHVGYGTKLHRELLKLHGTCELHRRSFKPVMELMPSV